MTVQALGERGALDGFWLGIGDALDAVFNLAQENIYLVLGLIVVAGYFLVRKR
jgi:hypothetical protein